MLLMQSRPELTVEDASSSPFKIFSMQTKLSTARIPVEANTIKGTDALFRYVALRVTPAKTALEFDPQMQLR
jgi:hypothetical protein